MNNSQIVLKKINVNNLKGVNLTLNTGELIVFTGVSGSGKSSLAFDTIFVEGERRYVEALSHQLKRFFTEIKKPDIQEALGLSPTIAIEQKTISKNPRSTVGTLSGIYDFLRILFAKAGTPHCPISDEIVSPLSRDQILNLLIKKYKIGSKLYVLTSYAKEKRGTFKEDFKELLKKGFIRVKVDDEFFDLNEIKELDAKEEHNIDIVIDRIVLSEEIQNLKEAISQALDLGNGFFSIFDMEQKEESFFSEYAYSPKSNLSYPALTPSDFSFNNPSSMCPKCSGLGEIFEFDLNKIIDPNLSISENCFLIGGDYNTIRYGNIYRNLGQIYNFKVTSPWKDLSRSAKDVLLYGTKQKWTTMRFSHPNKKRKWQEFVQWKGVLFEAHQRLIEAKSELYRNKMQALMIQMQCPDCKGHRLKPYPLATQIGGKKIFEITSLSIGEALDFFEKIQLDKESSFIAKDLLKEIKQKFSYMINVGLHYLSLDRSAPTLSGGEGQRVRLAAQLGTGLVGATYVLDEPSIGLHPQDNHKLIDTLLTLKEEGNTVIVVEHDRETMQAADTIVDVGPLAGKLGGEIVAQGPLEAIIQNERSLTGKYLSGKLKLKSQFKKRDKFIEYLELTGASHNNLKNITVKIPLKGFVCITGVSGSGKSSLISDTLYPALYNILNNSHLPCGNFEKIHGANLIDKVLLVDQSPIGRNQRSNPATYIKVFDEIREFFSNLLESKVRGYTPGYFSFNEKEGACPYCKGLGKIKLDMDFMEDEWTRCPQCLGRRFSTEVLSVKYEGVNINDLLEMDVASALLLFKSIPQIYNKLKVLEEIGLQYLHLGQSSNTLSGGEAQRIKLAKELSKKASGKTLYILDEPSTGLHFFDLQKLIDILQNLVQRGNSVIIIEHNMELAGICDYLIDMGPGGGNNGGRVIAEGSPDKIKKQDSPTGRALNDLYFSEKPKPRAKKKSPTHLIVQNAHLHNLKNLSLQIPLNKINVFTGPSGSGKSTLGFDTIYAEGQKRYIETMPLYVRQFFKLPKTEVDKIENLSPCIALEQKSHGNNPRSTVGTVTEIYDHLRVLFAHLGTAYCPESKEEIKSITKPYVCEKILLELKDQKISILSPLKTLKNEDFSAFKDRLLRDGFLRIRLNNVYYELDGEIPFNKSIKNELMLVIDRIFVEDENRIRILEALETASKISFNEIYVATEKKDLYFNLAFACESTGKSYPPITFQTFSFNSEEGMCLDCSGLGSIYGLNFLSSQEFLEHSIFEILSYLLKDYLSKDVKKLILDYFKAVSVDVDTPLCNLSLSERDLFLNGEKEQVKKKDTIYRFKGINTLLSFYAKHAKKPIQEWLIPLMEERECSSCNGKRLNSLAQNVRIDQLSITELCALSIDEAREFVSKIVCEKDFLKELIAQILRHLNFLIDIGLGYLSLDRRAPTLSGGEIQRIYLSKHLGSQLTHCIYVLDEPTIGLHPYNSDLLIKALKKLKDEQNTLILIEHDPEIIKMADRIFDFGPKAGILGGKLMAQGSLKEIMNNPLSLTGQYLSNQKKIELPQKNKRVFRRTPSDFIEIKDCNLHNLKNLSVDIPKNVMTAITGVSGSGKSSLINYILKPALEKALLSKEDKMDLPYGKVFNIGSFEKIISLDQKLISTSSRSDIGTYSELMPLIRSFYASLPLSKSLGLQPRHFSYNHLSGMCRTCWGFGVKKINLQFLPPTSIVCPTCHGFKLNSRSLQVKYKNKHLGQILDLTVLEALDFFSAFPKICKKLDTLIQVGLEYLQIGQKISTLSGGEGQRLKLSKELSQRTNKNTLYILDEPTIGLHSVDIEKLLKIFHSLTDKRATLIIIEHNLDIIANCDYIIDLGPYSGKFGGEVMGFGTPEQLSKNTRSYTAKYLQKKLDDLSSK